MKEFYLLPEFYKWLNRRSFITSLIFAAIIIPVGLLIGSRGQISLSTFATIPLLLGLLAIGSIIGAVNGYKLWKSYCLILSNTSVLKKQNGYPDLLIPFDKISKVVEIPGKGLVIFSQATNSQIHVPFLISGYTEIYETLRKSRVKIEVGHQDNKSYLVGVFVFLFLSAFVITLLSDNLWVMSITGIPVSLFLVASMTSLQNTPNTPKVIKQWAWLAILPVFSIILRILLSLMSVGF